MDAQEIINRVADRISREHEVVVVDLGGQASDPVRVYGNGSRGWDSTPFQNAGTTIQNVANWLHNQGGVGDLVEIHSDGSTTWYGVSVETDASDGVAESEIGEVLVTEIDYQDIGDEDDEELADCLGLDLSDGYRIAEATHVARWIEESENKEWELPTHGIRVGSRVLMWTLTDEAGVCDVTTVESDEDLESLVKDYAEDIASDLGELVEAE